MGRSFGRNGFCGRECNRAGYCGVTTIDGNAGGSVSERNGHAHGFRVVELECCAKAGGCKRTNSTKDLAYKHRAYDDGPEYQDGAEKYET